MVNLTDFIFTDDSDSAIVENDQITNKFFVLASTLGGDDTIQATLVGGSEVGNAIENSGLISTGLGNDSIKGLRVGAGGNGILNNQLAFIVTGKGDDSIVASVGIIGEAIINKGIILTGSGNDLFDATEVGFLATGIVNENPGIISTGKGDDSIIVSTGSRVRIAVSNSGLISTGKGHDFIFARGGFLGFSPVIENSDTISMGDGNDTLIGGPQIGNDTLTGLAIDNSGVISMGEGDDLIGTSFVGGGVTDLGAGNDSVSINPFDDNFQTINGGEGFDRIEFSFGLDDNVEFSISENVVELTRNSSTWTLSSFESFVFNDRTYSFDQLSDLI